MNEKELDQLLQVDDDMDISLEKNIKKRINKKIYFKSLQIFIVICLLVVCGYFGSSCLLNITHYDPNQEERFLEEGQEFDVLFQTYMSLIYPGKTYIAEHYNEKKYKASGFGNYEISAKICNSFDPLYMDGLTNTTFYISRSRLKNIETKEDHLFSLVVDEYKDPQDNHFNEISSLSSIYKELKDLPDSTVLDASISFKDYQSLKEIIDFMNEYPQTSAMWVALKDQNASKVEGISCGVSLYDSAIYSFTKEAQEKYPSYYLDQKVTAQSIQQHYLSRLQLLIDHPDFMKLMGTYFENELTIEQLQDNYQKAKKETKGYGLRIHTNKKDLIDMIEKGQLSYVYINDLKLSQYQK